MTDTNVIPLRPRADAPVQPIVHSLPPLRDAVFMAGMDAAADDDRRRVNFERIARDVRAAKASADEVVQLSDILDKVAQRARELARLSGRSALQIVAQDAESLSERLVHIAADLPEGA
jgi:hypothetical protein